MLTSCKRNLNQVHVLDDLIIHINGSLVPLTSICYIKYPHGPEDNECPCSMTHMLSEMTTRANRRSRRVGDGRRCDCTTQPSLSCGRGGLGRANERGLHVTCLSRAMAMRPFGRAQLLPHVCCTRRAPSIEEPVVLECTAAAGAAGAPADGGALGSVSPAPHSIVLRPAPRIRSRATA